jgi:hypothetical protein
LLPAMAIKQRRIDLFLLEEIEALTFL